MPIVSFAGALAERASGGRPLVGHGDIQADQIEQSLKALWGVRGARVETDSFGIKNIRLLVVPERSYGHILQEVRETIAGLTGTEIDPTTVKIMSVTDAGSVDPMGRRKLASLTTERTPDRFTARVALELEGDVLVGESEAPSVPRFEYRSVVRATVQGLSSLLRENVEVESIEFLQLGSERLAVVSLGTKKEILVGSAMVKVSDHDAVARATLDALNRLISRTSAERRPQRPLVH